MPTQITTEPNVGSVVSYLQGPRSGLPGYVAVPGITRPGPPPTTCSWPDGKAEAYLPFGVGGRAKRARLHEGAQPEKSDNPPAEVEENLRPEPLVFPDGLDAARLTRRAGLRSREFEHVLRQAEGRGRPGAMEDSTTRGPFAELCGAPRSAEAFDLWARSRAPVRDAYGRTKSAAVCRLRGELVEAGARFVMVDYGYDPEYGNLWDNHGVASQLTAHQRDGEARLSPGRHGPAPSPP